jgi:hypothetical protein
LKNGAKPIAAPVPIHGTSPRPSSVFDGRGPPILFETMAFGGRLDNFYEQLLDMGGSRGDAQRGGQSGSDWSSTVAK